MAEYTGVSIVDYLKSVGQPSDYASRSTLATSRGITNYQGTAQQNTQLLGMLRGGGTTSGAIQPTNQTPTSKDQVTPYLENYQSNLFQTTTAPAVKIPTMEELKTQLTPTTPYPTALNRVQELTTLKTTYGVADLEAELTSNKDQIRAEQDVLNAARGIEEGKPVPMGVIGGRISEEEKQTQVRLDALNRTQSRIVDELNTKYNVINQIMNLETLDYNDAVQRYETDFQANLKMYDLISGKEASARSAYEYDQQSARANLQIYANAAINGNISYDQLAPDQQLMIRKLEIQSGLPAGFIGSIKKDPKADILFTTSNEGITQVGFRNADGTVSVQSYGTRVSSTTESDKKRNYVNLAQEDASNYTNLKTMFNIYSGYLEPNEIYRIYNSASPFGVAGEGAKELAKYGVTGLE